VQINETTPPLPAAAPARRALVTGGTGFIGSHLVRRLLEAGYDVRVVARHPERNNEHRQLTPSQIARVAWVGAALSDLDAMEETLKDVDVVFHCAARISFHSLDRATLYKTNITGTAQLVDAILASGVRRLIHLSSVAALGVSTRTDGVVDEQAVWDQQAGWTNYAQSKYLAELEVWRGQEEGLEVAVVHPSIVLGPGKIDHRGSNRFYQMGRQGMPVCPTGTVGFVDVRDVAEVMLRLDRDSLLGRRYVLNAINLPYRALFEQLSALTGAPPPRWRLPFIPAMAVASVMEALSLLLRRRFPLTRETIRAACSHSQFDGSSVLSALPGYHYRDFADTLQDGLDFSPDS